MTLSAEPRTLTIGTRASALALVQTEMIRDLLQAASPGVQINIEHITTKGDIVLDRPLNLVGGKGLFITEIEDALREHRVDIAVHSAKDLPTEIPVDMQLVAFPPRVDVRDVVISHQGLWLSQLPAGARIGTSSVRRACQLRHLYPDLAIVDLRGNVDTRLRKLHEGQYDAIILAAAGLERLNLTHEITEYLEPTEMVPAVAQGSLAIEIRADDVSTAHLFAAIDHKPTRQAVLAERAFLATLNGGCSVPVGAYATIDHDTIQMTGMIGAIDGQMVRGTISGPVSDPEAVGKQLANQLLREGGAILLSQVDTPTNLPLQGKQIVVTRAAEQAEKLNQLLREAGAVPVVVPAIAITPPANPEALDAAIRELSSYDWVIAASANAVTALLERMSVLGVTRGHLKHCKIGAVGKATSAAWWRYHIRAAVVPTIASAEGFLAVLPDVTGQRILVPQSQIARPTLTDGLRDRGALVDVVNAYQTVTNAAVAPLVGALHAQTIDAITFASPSAVLGLLDGFELQNIDRDEALTLINRCVIACIGPTTTRAARAERVQVTTTATVQSNAGLVAALIEALTQATE